MRAGCSLRPRPTRNRPGLVASIVIALLAAVSSACTDSPPPAPTASPTPTATASPPPNPTTLSGITVSDTELMVVEGESVAIVVTLDSDPGEDIEVQVRLVRIPHRGLGGRDPDDITLAPDSVTWTATDWQQPRTVALTAIADKVRELVETHEIQVWTYVRGKTGADQHILAAETVQATTADSRGLVAITGGSEGEIVLEWTPADERTQRWQYREKAAWAYRNGQYYEPTWSAWLDVPQSDANTQSLRVTGLTPGWVYEFQVRPRPAGAGAASRVIDGATAVFGSDGIPEALSGFFLERGRRFRFDGSDFTFVVPPWMVLVVGSGGHPMTGVVAILTYAATGAGAAVDIDTGRMVRETVWDAATNSYKFVDSRTGEIVDSRRGLAPAPGHDLSVLWDEIRQSIRREPLP